MFNLQTALETRISNLEKEVETHFHDLRVERTKDFKRFSDMMDRKSLLSLEDQLFFGMVFSLLLLAVTFPTIEDLTSLFVWFTVNPDSALRTAQSIKAFLIGGLLASSFLRYYGCIKGTKKFRRFTLDFKFLSIEILILSSCFFLAPLVTTAFSSWITKINPFLGFFSALTAMLVFLGIGVLEKRWVSLYAKIGQTEQKSSSEFYLAFFCVALGIFIAYSLVVITAVVNAFTTFYIPLSTEMIIFLGMAISFSIIVFHGRWKRKRKSAR